jgi:Polyketide cyclase / dehydrase and lipid transport
MREFEKLPLRGCFLLNAPILARKAKVVYRLKVNSISHTIEIDAPASRVFQAYAEIDTWALWDNEVLEVSLPDGLRPGSHGWLRPRAGPKATIKIVSVRVNDHFTVESHLPLCVMRFEHNISEIDNQTKAKHWVEFSGPLAWLFRRIIGRQIDATLPATLAGLKRWSESKNGTAR